MIIPTLLGEAAFGTVFLMFHPGTPNLVTSVMMRMMLALPIGAITILVLSGLFCRRIWQWHACEHKTLMLFRRGLAPTLENLRAVTPVSPFCGTVWALLFCGISAAIALLKTYPHASLGVWTSCMAALTVYFLLAASPRRNNLHRILLALGAPAILVAMAMERMFVLRKPSDEQLGRTLAVAIAAARRHSWLLSPRLRRQQRLNGSPLW